MASIFLSYAREDVSKAKAIAKSLERAGHGVWWDRQIHGGSDFSGEIETALRDADVVLVLWSEAATRSAWVKDEASEGRDSDRLVPIILDDCSPPLGFRQLQSISIKAWSGRGNPPELKSILAAVARRAGSPAAALASETKVVGKRRLALAGLVAIAALLTAIGAWWLIAGSRLTAERTPVLAVLPFSDLSQEGDRAYLAEGVAEAILTVLAKEPGIRVLGRSSAKQLHEAGKEAQDMRRALGITHVLEGSARSVGDQLRMSVRLIDAADGQQIWTEEYHRRLDNIFSVQDEIGRAVAQKLKGTIATNVRAAQQLTSADAYTLYLAARAKMRDRRLTSLRDAQKMTQQVIAADPNYAPGHALYAELIWHMSIDNYGTLSMERVRQLGEPHARRAIELAPNSSEGHAALGAISKGEAAVKSLTRAIQLDPARAELRLWLARAQTKLGNNASSLEQFEKAAEIEPLFGPVIWNYAWMLAASERYEDVESLIVRFEQHGGSRATAERIRAEVAGYGRGDYAEGIRHARRAVQIDQATPIGEETLARQYARVGLYSESARFVGSLARYTRLQLSGQDQRLVSLVKKDGANVWNDPDIWTAVRALAASREWTTLDWLFDSNPGAALKLVCGEGNPGTQSQLGLDFAQALLATGRTSESTQLLGCVRRILTIQGRGSVRSAFMGNAFLDLFWAQVHAIEGRPQRAFPLLRHAVARGYRTTYGKGLSEFPAFDRYQSSPEYSEVDTRLKQLIARERAEVLRAQPGLRQAA